MDEPPDRTKTAVGGGVRLLALAGGVVLLWLMGFTVYAVVMRYVFNAPLLGAQDISEVSLVVIVFFGLAYCGWTGGHVAVDLISLVAGRRALRRLDAVVHAVCGLLFAYIAWLTVLRMLDARETGDASNLIEIPLFPFFAIVAFGSATYALILFIQAAHAGGRDRRRDDL